MMPYTVLYTMVGYALLSYAMQIAHACQIPANAEFLVQKDCSWFCKDGFERVVVDGTYQSDFCCFQGFRRQQYKQCNRTSAFWKACPSLPPSFPVSYNTNLSLVNSCGNIVCSLSYSKGQDVLDTLIQKDCAVDVVQGSINETKCTNSMLAFCSSDCPQGTTPNLIPNTTDCRACKTCPVGSITVAPCSPSTPGICAAQPTGLYTIVDIDSELIPIY